MQILWKTCCFNFGLHNQQGLPLTVAARESQLEAVSVFVYRQHDPSFDFILFYFSFKFQVFIPN